MHCCGMVSWCDVSRTYTRNSRPMDTTLHFTLDKSNLEIPWSQHGLFGLTILEGRLQCRRKICIASTCGEENCAQQALEAADSR